MYREYQAQGVTVLISPFAGSVAARTLTHLISRRRLPPSLAALVVRRGLPHLGKAQDRTRLGMRASIYRFTGNVVK